MRALALVSTSSLLLLACGNSDRGGDNTDGGVTIMPDDTGTIMLMDTSSPTQDSGGPPGECPPITVPAPAPACSMAQLQSFGMAQQSAASDMGAALQTWFMDPANAGCGTCLDQAILAAATMGGCAQVLGDGECCLQEACPTMDQACLQQAAGMGGTCASAQDNLIMCIRSNMIQANPLDCQMM